MDPILPNQCGLVITLSDVGST